MLSSLHVDLGLGLSRSLDVVGLGVDAVVALGNEGLVAGAGAEDINGQAILVGCQLSRVNGVDRVGVGHDHDNSVLGGLHLLRGHGVVHGGNDNGLAVVHEDDILVAAGPDADVLTSMMMAMAVVGLVMVVVVLLAGVAGVGAGARVRGGVRGAGGRVTGGNGQGDGGEECDNDLHGIRDVVGLQASTEQRHPLL